MYDSKDQYAEISFHVFMSYIYIAIFTERVDQKISISPAKEVGVIG